jgi:predicted DNA-binding protein
MLKQTSMLSARIPEALDMRLNALTEKTHRSKAILCAKP